MSRTISAEDDESAAGLNAKLVFPYKKPLQPGEHPRRSERKRLLRLLSQKLSPLNLPNHLN
jgi:hypothetical protein